MRRFRLLPDMTPGITRPLAALACLVLFPVLCVPELSGQESLLGRYELDAREPNQHRLPRRLQEVSGLALTSDGRLFAHGDESAVVHELDRDTGDIVKSFTLGHDGIEGDFEGLAIVGSRFFLVTSDGTIYEFEEGGDGDAVPFHGYPTALVDRCEVEGLVFDPVSDQLLLACKNVEGGGANRLVVFAFRIDAMALAAEPWLDTSLALLEQLDLDNDLHPSGIEYSAETDSFLIVAAQEETIVVVSRNGDLVDGLELRNRNHPQTEGIALARDGTLILADEGGGGRAHLTVYPRMR